MKKAIICGVTGQDGAYLTKHLINNGYIVYGLMRKNMINNFRALEKLNISDKIIKIKINLLNYDEVFELIKSIVFIFIFVK